MPTITRIYGGNQDERPLCVTHRKGSKKKSPSIRVKCACCDEAVVVFPEHRPDGNSQTDSVEINGVHGSIAQWREILLPILGYPSSFEPSRSSFGLEKLHIHPHGGEMLYGRRLRPGDVLQKADRLGSSSGNWGSVPMKLVGKTIKNNLVVYIRPGT